MMRLTIGVHEFHTVVLLVEKTFFKNVKDESQSVTF